jgi:Flp pilus assembly protein protease CpaA
MTSVVFYIFSFLLSFTDYKSFRVPNVLIGTMSVVLLYFMIVENKVYMSSLIIPLVVLLFFIVLLILKPKMILGGGDIKYMMIVALYLPYIEFALFLVISGVLQSVVLLYIQNIKKRKIAPMVPIMFLSVILTEIFVVIGLYPIKF